MNRLTTLICSASAFGLCVCVVAPSARADAVAAGDYVRFYDREGTLGGGEFGIAKTAPSTPTPELFRTFCIQRTEFVDFDPAGFKITGINAHTVAGDDYISDKTAYLYTQFRQGTLPGYDVSTTAARVASANALQTVFWYLEDEPSFTNFSVVSSNAKALSFYNLAVDATTVGGVTDAWVGMGIGNVRVMNLVWATTRNGFAAGTYAQDQLVLVPTPFASMAGTGLVGTLIMCGAISRRMRRVTL
jgi:hypothetical protein